jgi:hypothetical protein
MKVIIAGGRDFNNYELLKQKCDTIFANIDKSQLIIITGKASGADSLGERYAKENNLKVMAFPALWEDFSKKPILIKKRKNGRLYNVLAGLNRNTDMANEADALIAFWDGKSTGTNDMIQKAKERNLPYRIIFY